MKRRYFVYMLLCSDHSIYVGVTNNLERRLEEHRSGCNEKSYVANRLPFELIYVEEFIYIRNAIAREKQLKGWSREKKIALSVSNKRRLKELSACKNDSSFRMLEKDKQ